MVPEGIDDVELARIEIEALERECKAMAEVGGVDIFHKYKSRGKFQK